jgi:DNA-binding MarR family transcriptional regulator
MPSKPATPRRDPTVRNGLLFSIVALANAAARPFVETIGETEQINLSEWRCMIAIAAEPGLSGEEVARLTGLDRMTVSRSLRSLETAERTTRNADPHDLKRNLWEMTDEGWAVYDRIAKQALIRQVEFLDILTTAEQKELARLLKKLER